METLIAFAICLAFYAIGDVISIVTKAKMPALAASICAYLIAIWVFKMPKGFPEASGMAAIGNTLFIIFVATTATSVTPSTMIREWKFVVIGIISSGLGLLFTLVFGGIFFDLREMLAGAMTTCGLGFAGGLIVIEKMQEAGLASLITVPLLLASTRDIFGQPIGAFFAKRYVKELIETDAYLHADKEKKVFTETKKAKECNRYGASYDSPENPSPWFTAWIPPKYETEAVALFQLGLAVAISYWIGENTGLGWMLALILICQIGSLFGYFRLNMMERTASSGIIMAAIYAMVFQMLNDLTMSDILHKLLPIFVIVVLGVCGILLGGVIGAKIFGYDIWLATASVIGLLYLFPGIKNIINEVARSYGRNEEECSYIIEKLSAPAIITATIGGIVCLLIGAIMMPLLFK